MVFLKTVKSRLLAGLAASNRLAHHYRLPKALRGGPIRANGHFEAGGFMAAKLLDPKVVFLHDPLIYYRGDPNILSSETCGDITEIRFNEVALWEYRDARVLPGAHGGLHGISTADRVIPGLNHQCLDENLFFETRFQVPKCSDFLESGFLVDGGPGANFYHWKIDILPALGLARKALGAGVKFILNPYSKKREAQWDELGISAESRVVTKGPLRVGKLYAIGGLHNSLYGLFRPEPCIEFWRNFAKPQRHFRRLFVSRQDSNRRSLKNEADLFARLELLGFEKVVLDGLSLATQANLFSEAKDVIAMHGAGLSNFIHCQEGTRLVEIFPPGYSHGFYQYICRIRGGIYNSVNSEKVIGELGPSEFNVQPGFLGEEHILKILSFFSD
jgi:hypothetical protein